MTSPQQCSCQHYIPPLLSYSYRFIFLLLDTCLDDSTHALTLSLCPYLVVVPLPPSLSLSVPTSCFSISSVCVSLPVPLYHKFYLHFPTRPPSLSHSTLSILSTSPPPPPPTHLHIPLIVHYVYFLPPHALLTLHCPPHSFLHTITCSLPCPPLDVYK